jgi:hypothetical protein
LDRRQGRKHELKLLHQDVLDFYSTHPIVMNETQSIIEIAVKDNFVGGEAPG